jgi:hypothetical protein
MCDSGVQRTVINGCERVNLLDAFPTMKNLSNQSVSVLFLSIVPTYIPVHQSQNATTMMLTSRFIQSRTVRAGVAMFSSMKNGTVKWFDRTWAFYFFFSIYFPSLTNDSRSFFFAGPPYCSQERVWFYRARRWNGRRVCASIECPRGWLSLFGGKRDNDNVFWCVFLTCGVILFLFLARNDE